MKNRFFVLFICLLITCSCHRQVPPQSKKAPPNLPLGIALESQLTIPGSKPFHLKAVVMEATNPENDSYKAEIEQYWGGPDRWRRTIKSEGFSSDLVVNGRKRGESVSGDYYPNWLRTLVTAIFEPVTPIRDLDLTAPSDNPMPGSALLCRRYSTSVGIPPVQNSVFSTVCFSDNNLESVGLPGYHAEYKDYKDFGGKLVPRTVREYIEPGTEVKATITELTELSTIDESKLEVTKSPPPIQTLLLSEDTLRKMAHPPLELKWPPITGGKAEGVLSIYICLDRTGRVRESYALNSDHPEMSDAAQQQLSKIQFTPAMSNHKSAQAEGILTFSYKTVVEKTAQ